MSVDVERQVREFWATASSDLPELNAEELMLTGGVVKLAPYRPVSRSRPGWLVALAGAAAVLLLVGGVGLAARLIGGERTAPVSELPTPTTTEPVTTIAAPDTTVTPAEPSTTVLAEPRVGLEKPSPPSDQQPQMVDLPGEGVLLTHGSQNPFVLDAPRMWSFQPDVGWTFLQRLPDPALLVWILAYDEASGLIWMDVHSTDRGVYEIDEIWTYAPASGELTRVETAGGPAGVDEYEVALDTESRRLVFFMWGWGDFQPSETWVFDIDAHLWTQMSPELSPDGRSDPGMAYDAESDRVILFGGAYGEAPDNVHYLDDTWAYDFNTDSWTNMSPALAPTPSVWASMEYDPVTDRMILFGGYTTAGRLLSDTWTYDYNTNTWTQLQPAASPTRRDYAAIARDAQTGMIVLFGGGTSTGGILNDTWLFDPIAETWTQW